jgi:DNA-damage-inducible protein J
MTETTNLSIRIDRNLKEQADIIFNEMGMNLTTAITVFVRQTVRQKKIPFEITLNTGEVKNAAIPEALSASERIWQSSISKGSDKMTLEEINAEIAIARAERKKHGTNQ